MSCAHPDYTHFTTRKCSALDPHFVIKHDKHIIFRLSLKSYLLRRWSWVTHPMKKHWDGVELNSICVPYLAAILAPGKCLKDIYIKKTFMAIVSETWPVLVKSFRWRRSLFDVLFYSYWKMKFTSSLRSFQITSKLRSLLKLQSYNVCWYIWYSNF